eukprot:SAG31_NODE_1656_length_7621_cov_3.193433_1_plen_155_part_00
MRLHGGAGTGGRQAAGIPGVGAGTCIGNMWMHGDGKMGCGGVLTAFELVAASVEVGVHVGRPQPDTTLAICRPLRLQFLDLLLGHAAAAAPGLSRGRSKGAARVPGILGRGGGGGGGGGGFSGPVGGRPLLAPPPLAPKGDGGGGEGRGERRGG